MPDLAAALADCLARAQGLGDFDATGTFDIPPPRPEIPGIGRSAARPWAADPRQGRPPQTSGNTPVRQ